MSNKIIKPYQYVGIVPETTYAGARGATGYKIAVDEDPLPNLAQSVLTPDSPRIGMLAPAPYPGVQGGAFSLKIPLVHARASPADGAVGATAMEPDGWAPTLMSAILGLGGVANAAPASIEHGRKGKGSLIVSTANDPVDTINVTAAEGARFNQCDAILVKRLSSPAIPYPIIVRKRVVDALTVVCGPTAAAGLANNDVIFGTYGLPLPNKSDAGWDKSFAVEIKDFGGQYYHMLGCCGSAVIESAAGDQMPYLNASLMYDAWDIGGTTDGWDGAVTWTPWPNRQRIVGKSQYARAVLTGAGLTATIPCSKWSLDLGIQRAETADVNGAQGRSSRWVSGLNPKLTVSLYYDTAYMDALVAGNTMSITLFQGLMPGGSGAYGGFGIIIPAAAIDSAPTKGDVNGLATHELVLRPLDLEETDLVATPDVPPLMLFWV